MPQGCYIVWQSEQHATANTVTAEPDGLALCLVSWQSVKQVACCRMVVSGSQDAIAYTSQLVAMSV